jgi:hypothetical protein
MDTMITKTSFVPLVPFVFFVSGWRLYPTGSGSSSSDRTYVQPSVWQITCRP